MDGTTSEETIRKVAGELDRAIEEMNSEAILSRFSEECEIELLGTRLGGKEGVVKWAAWMNLHLAEVKVSPITVIIEGNTLFEEFVLRAKLHTGAQIDSKQAEVIVFENSKIKNLRLYFDRTDFADSLVKGFVNRSIAKRLIKRSLEGLS